MLDVLSSGDQHLPQPCKDVTYLVASAVHTCQVGAWPSDEALRKGVAQILASRLGEWLTLIGDRTVPYSIVWRCRLLMSIVC